MKKKRRRRKRNNRRFTTDEVQTATLMYTEGTVTCARERKNARYAYPEIRIRLCVKEGLLPASRVLGVKVGKEKRREISCAPEAFPPDGKGWWRVAKKGKEAVEIIERLSPLIPEYYNKRWRKVIERCKS